MMANFQSHSYTLFILVLLGIVSSSYEELFGPSYGGECTQGECVPANQCPPEYVLRNTETSSRYSPPLYCTKDEVQGVCCESESQPAAAPAPVMSRGIGTPTPSPSPTPSTNSYGVNSYSEYNNADKSYDKTNYNDYDDDYKEYKKDKYMKYKQYYKQQKAYMNYETDEDPWSPFILGCVKSCISKKMRKIYKNSYGGYDYEGNYGYGGGYNEYGYNGYGGNYNGYSGANNGYGRNYNGYGGGGGGGNAPHNRY